MTNISYVLYTLFEPVQWLDVEVCIDRAYYGMVIILPRATKRHLWSDSFFSEHQVVPSSGYSCIVFDNSLFQFTILSCYLVLH